MPMTMGDKKLLGTLRTEYGSDAERVFYAGANKGTFGPAQAKRHSSKARAKRRKRGRA